MVIRTLNRKTHQTAKRSSTSISNRPKLLRVNCHRHPIVLGTTTLALFATALSSFVFEGNSICSAFAASTYTSLSSSSSFGILRRPKLCCVGSFSRKPLFERNQRKMSTGINEPDSTSHIARKMISKVYAPIHPLATVSPFSRVIKKVFVVGGTHGNEYTGIWCIKALERQREIFIQNQDTRLEHNIFQEYPSLEIGSLLANPLAYMQNKRFIDVDLNREFSVEKLKRVTAPPTGRMENEEECDVHYEFCSSNEKYTNSSSSLPHEAIRAREIEAILGPKVMTDLSTHVDEISSDPLTTDDSNPEPLSDVVIDLHTTTANMGISLIIPEGDPLMSAAAAYVLHQCKTKYGYDSVQCLMHALPKRKDRQNLSSCGRHGFTIEVGPVPQGVLRHDAVEKTEAALHSLLEFLHLRNLELENDVMMEGKSTVLEKLREMYPSNIVPCYRSAPAIRPGELSGKISWENDASNPNFPAVIVHKSLQDRDFEPLHVGDPLFVTLDGSVIPYDGSHGEKVHLIFVNEGGYYYESSGTGIGVAIKSQFDWETGWFFEESDEEGVVGDEVVLEEKDSFE